ncbi:DUF4190 domain-containing protein [Leucobacter coleopterorum]|uniref:DUF4190 domain-containing protein n=1 Tax=Leucobacter coleopterorum TaxID=2714933 RepID=A0ABX6JVB0_9MICO|nr:DUF4190 domain-containing protein [Leucobacter coleopterorum]QIM18168.1 DUF4190 domain-containing protein [Leucobacter coleopterorum]
MSTPNVPQQPTAPQQPGYSAPQYTPQNPAPHQSYPQAPASAQFTQQAQSAASKTTTLDKTNTFALVSIILAFISPIAAIVFGHLSLSQIKRTGDAGRGMALTGLIIGYVYAVSIVFFVIAYVGLIVALVGSASYMSRY